MMIKNRPAIARCYNLIRLLKLLGRLVIASTLAIWIMPNSFAAQPKWITMKNDNFRIYSTAKEGDTREVINQLERVRSFFNQFTSAESIKHDPVSVMIFGSEKEYREFRINDFAVAYYTNHANHDLIVIGVLGEESSKIASHEYTHLVFQHAGYSLPPWLNEGIAELYSTLSPAGNETEFGDVIPGRLYELNNEPWVPLEIILAADKSSPYYNETKKAGSLYNESWALVHMLNTTQKYRTNFWRVVEAVNNGMPSVQALVNTYGVPFFKLESELKNYVEGDRFNQIRIKLKLDDTEKLTSQPVDMFEVRELQAELLTNLPGKQAEARKRLEELITEDDKRFEPQTSLGYLAWRQGNANEAAEHLSKAFELGNRNPRFLQDFAQIAGNNKPDASSAALKILLEMEPNNIDARLLYANLLMSQDKFAAAATIVSSINTVRSDEQRDNLLYLRAYAAMRLGFQPEARALAEQLQTKTTSMEFRMRATQILRSLERR